MKEESPITCLFQIKSIELIDFSLNQSQLTPGDKVSYNFDINIEHRLNIENSCLFVVCTINTYDELRKLLLSCLKSSCCFFIENLATYFDTKTKDLQLPHQVVVSLNSISISTTRGLMYSQFRGTSLHNAVLPIIDPTSFLMEK